MNPAGGTQRCVKCGQVKPLDHEHFNRTRTGQRWKTTCKACLAAVVRAYYDKDPDKVKARAKKYHDQKRKVGDAWTDEDVKTIRRSLNDSCAYCGTPLNGGGEVDHIVPISRGGTNEAKNLTLACRTCNRDKHSKTGDEFRKWLRERQRPVRQQAVPHNSDRPENSRQERKLIKTHRSPS
jgi:5-methylcytosine-specific restriction endonuclease McrA